MKLSLPQKLLAFFLTSFLVMLLLAIASYRHNKAHLDTIASIEHADTVRLQADRLLLLLREMESLQRGYLLTGNEALLQYFNFSIEQIPPVLENLKSQQKKFSDSPRLIDSLEHFVTRRVAFARETVDAAKKQGLAAGIALVNSGHGTKLMDEVRRLLNEIQHQASLMLTKRKKEVMHSEDEGNLLPVVQLIVSVLLLSFFAIVLYNNLQQRQKAEKKLLEKDLLLQSILDNTTNYIYIKDLNGRYILANKAYENTVQRKKSEMIGKTVFELFEPQTAAILQQHDALVAEKKHLIETQHTLMNRGRKHHLWAVRFPLFDSSDRMFAVCGILSDISDLVNRDELIKDLYDHAPAGYYSIDANGIIINANETALAWLGYSREELIGQSFMGKVLDPCCLEDFRQTFSRFKQEGVLKEKEFMYVRKDGSRFPVLLNATAVKDEAGNFLHSRSTIFDFTKTKKMEEELQILNRELESFSYSVSHDLRAPLRIINGYSQILLDEYSHKMDEEMAAMLAKIADNVRRMGQLIDDLLNFSRLGRREVSRHKTDMNLVVNEVMKEQLQAMPHNHYQINMQQLRTACCDSGLIKVVWQNLISNALKYSGKQPAPKIEIGSEEKNGEVIYFIKDNGAGFDMQYHEKLFGVFQRLHKVSEYEGTGVGLALAHRIVMKHGGRIWARSEVGKGACFYFSLPKTD